MSGSLCRVFVHLVWATYQRTPWLRAELAPAVHEHLRQRCHPLECTPVAVGGVEDHVHVLVQLSPRVAISTLVAKLKAPTTAFAQRRCGLEDFAWQSGYGAFSVGGEHVEAVTQYIQNQREHHALRALRSEWELQEGMVPRLSDLPTVRATRSRPSNGL